MARYQADVASAASLGDLASQLLKAAEATGDAGLIGDSYALIGDVARARGDLTGAEQGYTQYLAIAERVAALEPADINWQQRLAVAHSRIGDLAQLRGDLAGADQAYSQSLAITERQAARDPTNTGWQRELAAAHSQIGDLAQTRGDLAGAEQAYSQSLAITERQAARDPTNTGWQRELAAAHSRIGDLAQARGDLPGAEQAYTQALAICQRLATLDPTNTSWQWNLAGAFSRIGDLAQARGDLPGAEQAYTQALAICQRLATLDPTDTGWQQRLAAAHSRIGDLAQARGDLPGAEQAYTQALAICQRLATLDPTNTSWQWNLAGAFSRIGDLAQTSDDLPGAEQARTQALAITEHLAAQDPSGFVNMMWHRRSLLIWPRSGLAVTPPGQHVSSQAQVNREIAGSQAAMGAGILAPGDPPPVPGGPDCLDYRGVATVSELGPLDQRRQNVWTFRAGMLLDPRRGSQGPVGLDAEVLRGHAAIVGPAGSGKTMGVIIPWIYTALALGHSVVATDVKGDLHSAFLGYAQAMGRRGVNVVKWDFTDPGRSVDWDWVSELVDDNSLTAAVTAILGRENKQGSADPFFYRRNAIVLRGLLRVAPRLHPAGVTPRGLLNSLGDSRQMQELIVHHPDWPGVSDLASVLRGVDAVDHARVVIGVMTALSKIDNPGFAAVTQPSPTKLDGLLAQPTLLVVSAPLRQGEIAQVASTLVLNLLVQRLYRGFVGQHRHCFLFVDEAPQLVDRFPFEEVLTMLRSVGMSVILAAQDLAQFKDENERSSILVNCATMLMLAGSSPQSAELISKRLGSNPVSTSSAGDQAYSGVSPSLNRTISMAPVLGGREIMQLPFGGRPAILHVNTRELGITTKPMLVDLTL